MAFSIRRGLITLDIAANVPAGSTITFAALTLRMSQTTTLVQPVELRRVFSGWGEGTSVAPGNGGGGDSAATGDTTWVHRIGYTGE